MKIFIVNAFTSNPFSGNQAGVVLLGVEEDFPEANHMLSVAKELKHSETCFVKKIGDNSFRFRYFSPTDEVGFCGHATIAGISLLREINLVEIGKCTVKTNAEIYNIDVRFDSIFITMPAPKHLYILSEDDNKNLCASLGITKNDIVESQPPQIIEAGLKDIILMVKNDDVLDKILLNRELLVDLSIKLDVVGVHVFSLCSDNGLLAKCRNFAPRFGIDEECATGTSNAGLTSFLDAHNKIIPNKINNILQGNKMGAASTIRTLMLPDKNVQIGGDAYIAYECIPFSKSIYAGLKE